MEKDYWLGHRERLRKRAEEEGFEALKPHEMIELALFYAMPRVDMTETARALYNQLGSIGAVFNAPREALMAVPGVNANIAEWIMLTGEMLRAYSCIQRRQMPRIWRFRDMMTFLAPFWRQVPAPCCWMVFTDYDNRLMTWTVIADSLYWADAMVTREIVREVMALQARHAYLVMFTGVEPQALSPYEEDYLVLMGRTLRAIDVELLDCVMVGEPGFYSMNCAGRFDRVRMESENPGLHERYCDDE